MEEHSDSSSYFPGEYKMSATEKASLEEMEEAFSEEPILEPVGEVNKKENESVKKELSEISIGNAASGSTWTSRPSSTVNELMSGLRISEAKAIQKGRSPDSQGVTKKKAWQNKSVSLKHSVVAKPGEPEEKGKGIRRAQDAKMSEGVVKMPKRKHTDSGLDLNKKTPREQEGEIEQDSVVTKKVRFQKNAPKEAQFEKPPKQTRAGYYCSPLPLHTHPHGKSCIHKERNRPGGTTDRPGGARLIPQHMIPSRALYAPPKPVPATYSYSSGPVLRKRSFSNTENLRIERSVENRRMEKFGEKKDDLPICLLEKLNKQYRLLKVMHAQRNHDGKNPCEHLRRLPVASQAAIVCPRCHRPRPLLSDQWKDVGDCQYTHQACLCTARVIACQRPGERAQRPVELTPLQAEAGVDSGKDKLTDKKDSEIEVTEKVTEKKAVLPIVPAMPDIAKLNINENPMAAGVSILTVATDLKQLKL